MNVPLANAGPHLIIWTVQMLAPPRMMIVPKQNLQEGSFMDPKTNLRTHPTNQVTTLFLWRRRKKEKYLKLLQYMIHIVFRTHWDTLKKLTSKPKCTKNKQCQFKASSQIK